MKKTLNGNGNGVQGVVRELTKKTAKIQAAASSHALKESQVTFRTTDGVELSGALARVTRHAVFFELYNPSATPRLSETLDEFKIVLQGQTVYSGRATVRNVMEAGTTVICETTLRESDWTPLNPENTLQHNAGLANEFQKFLSDWQKLYKLLPEYKVVIADMQTFLHDLRLWLEKIELGIRIVGEPSRAELERKTVAELSPLISQSIDVFINQFESIVAKLEPEAHPSYYAHLRRQLHPLLLVSPFANRAFGKPLGYAGDYQMVDMMIRSPYEGDTLFAKIINIWLLGQSPAQAHRNRVAHLERKLIEETARVSPSGRSIKILNLGCGPAAELQHFFAEHRVHNQVDLTLVDFNEETLEYLGKKLDIASRGLLKPSSCRLIKKSVYQILKDSGRSLPRIKGEKYDYIYCAGLFDYLSDSVCKQIMNIFYEMLAPGGLLLATNATDVLNSSKPFRYSMEYILDWFLIYRDKNRFAAVAPDLADPDDIKVIAESTGANFFLEVKKKKNV